VISVIIAFITAILGMIGVSSAMMGFFIRHSKAWERWVLFVGGICLIMPEMITNFIGLALLGLVWYVQKQREDDSGKNQPLTATT